MKHLASLLLLVAVTAPICANAGMAVTDPKSYTYYMKQLKEAQDQLKKMQEQLDVATETKKQVTDMAADVTGVYNRAKGIKDDLDRVKTIANNPRRVFSDAERIMDLAENPEEVFKEVDVNLDSIFVDLSDPDINPWMVQKKKQNEVQKIFKDAMRNTEIELASMPARMEAIEKLTSQIDTTENIKDSQDLTNRLIAELVIGQERMITILSQLAQAEVAAQFMGYDKQVADEFRARSSEKKEAGKRTNLEKMFDDRGTKEAYEGPASDIFGL